MNERSKRPVYMNENERWHKAIAHKCLYEIRNICVNVRVA